MPKRRVSSVFHGMLLVFCGSEGEITKPMFLSEWWSMKALVWRSVVYEEKDAETMLYSMVNEDAVFVKGGGGGGRPREVIRVKEAEVQCGEWGPSSGPLTLDLGKPEI